MLVRRWCIDVVAVETLRFVDHRYSLRCSVMEWSKSESGWVLRIKDSASAKGHSYLERSAAVSMAVLIIGGGVAFFHIKRTCYPIVLAPLYLHRK
jgi:hypothetical protein